LEFNYSKEQRDTIPQHMRGAAVTATASNTVTKSEETPVFEEKPSVTEPTEQSEVEEQQPQEIAQNNDNSNLKSDTTDLDREKPAETPAATEETKELPRTAGELPVLALIGFLCLGAGLGVKVISAKS
jgi:hypothetical protein